MDHVCTHCNALHFAGEALSSSSSEARTMLYQDLPSRYTWDAQEKIWRRRLNSAAAIGRLFHSHPREGERYFLRLLLTVVRGPTSFADLKTLPSGEIAETYQQACEHLGLLESDIEWHRCLREAANFQVPSQLRRLFATILEFSSPGDPNSLLNEHWKEMSEDFLH